MRKTWQWVFCGVFVLGCSSSPTIVERATNADANPEALEPKAAPKPLEVGLKRLTSKGYERYRHSDFAGAIQQWEPVWLTTGRSTDTWTPSLLYYCYLATGQYAKALAMGEAELKRNPHGPLGYHQIGMAALWLGKYKDAEQALRQAAEFDDRPADVFFHLGLALQRQNKKGESEKLFDRGEEEYGVILKSNPSDFPANYGLAYSYLYRGKNTEQAIEKIKNARESLRINPDVELTPDKNLYLGFYLPLLEGIAASRQGNARDAIEPLLTALQNSPSGARADLAEVYHFLGKSLKELGETAPSKAYLAKAVELDPFGPYAKVKVP